MIPYADALWHWFGRGQFYLLALNGRAELDWDRELADLGDVWMKVKW